MLERPGLTQLIETHLQQNLALCSSVHFNQQCDECLATWKECTLQGLGREGGWRIGVSSLITNLKVNRRATCENPVV